jgi:RHS repeat-associated protein
MDANKRTTTYVSGPPPRGGGIGEILTITHPGGSHIDYTYYDHGHYVHTVSNERQKVTTYTRDADTHLVTRIDYPQDANTPASHEEFTYNNFGQVLTHRLKNGAWESFVYDGRGLLTDKYNPKTTVPGGNDPHTHYSYYTGVDGNPGWIDRVKTMTLPVNVSGYAASETYEYDLSANNTSRGLVTRIQHADGNYQSFSYDAYGNKLWEENELRNRTTYTYDDYNRVLTVKNPLNNTTQYDYASLQGNVTQAQQHTTNSPRWIIAPSGITTRNVYDEDWRKTSSTPAFGVLSPTSFVYDNVGNLTDVTDPRGKVTHHGYDNRNRKTSTTEAYGITGLAATTAWHYDPASNINQIDRPDGVHETKGYDALNRMIWHTVPRQLIGGGQVNIRTDITYNPSGTIWKVRDPKAHWTIFDYDPSDRKIRMTYPGTNGTQEWAYDNAGNLKSRTTVRGGTEIQRFDYDNLNRKTDMSWDNNADEAHYTYYADGRLNTASNPNSTVTRQYDDAGHLTRDQQYIPGLGTKLVNYPPYDDDGRLTGVSVTNPNYDYTYSYDGAGRFWKIFASANLNNALFEYQYDGASNEINRLTYLTGPTIKQVYARDSLNRMESRVLKRNTATISGTLEAYTYDHMNRIRGVTRGDLADSFNYYWTGELSSAHYNGQADAPYIEGQEPDLDTTETLDPSAGYQPPETEEAEPAPPPDDAAPPDPTSDTTPSPNVTPPSDVPPAEDPGKEQKTVGDYLGDGQQGPADGPGQPDLFTPRNATYNLDNAGNRTSVTDNVNGNATYVPNVLNQYTSVGGSSVTNGPEHEIRIYNSVTYDYINDEHLKQVTSNAGTYILAYDALGRCVKRTLNGFTTYYIYDGEKPILEYRSGNLNNPAKNVYGKGIDEILMRYDPTLTQNQTFYYQQDHEGSVTHLIDTSGNLIETYRYDAFGAPAIYDVANPPHRLSSSSCSNRFLFTGREYANLFGFYEYRARAYHPGLGRFMSEDPKLFDAGDYNLFRYCHNDPIDFTDPMGLEDTLPPGPNHASPLIEQSKRQMHFDRSDGAVATGLRAFKAVKDFVVGTDRMTGGPQYRALIGNYIKWTKNNRAAMPRWAKNFLQFIDDTGGIGLGVPIGGLSVGTGIMANTGSGGPVIIGETMTRVQAAAASHPGAVILDSMPDFKALGSNADQVTSAMMQFDRRWTFEQLRSGRQWIDIGRDPNRTVPSIFYQMETNMRRNYLELHPELSVSSTP